MDAPTVPACCGNESGICIYKKSSFFSEYCTVDSESNGYRIADLTGKPCPKGYDFSKQNVSGSTDEHNPIHQSTTVTVMNSTGERPYKTQYVVTSDASIRQIVGISWRFADGTGSVQYVPISVEKQVSQSITYSHTYLSAGSLSATAWITYTDGFSKLFIVPTVIVSEPDVPEIPPKPIPNTSVKAHIYRVVEFVVVLDPVKASAAYCMFKYPGVSAYAARPQGGVVSYDYDKDNVENHGLFDGHDIQFEVVTDNEGNANTAEIRVYNIPRELREQVTKPGLLIQLSAGYESDFHVLIDGMTDIVYSTFEGLDVVTVFKCTNQVRHLYNDVHTKTNDNTYPPGTPYEDIIKDAVEELQDAVGIDRIDPTGYKTTTWETYVGKPYHIIEDVTRKVNGFLARDANNKSLDDPRLSHEERVALLLKPKEADTFIWFIRKNSGFVFTKKGVQDTTTKKPQEIAMFTTDSGLLSFEPNAPDQLGEESEWTAKLLLTAWVDCMDIVQIRPAVFGEVNKGNGKMHPISFLVTSVHHTGSTFGQEYYTTLKGKRVRSSDENRPLIIDISPPDPVTDKGYDKMYKYLNVNKVGG